MRRAICRCWALTSSMRSWRPRSFMSVVNVLIALSPKLEALFAELKSHSHIGLNRLRLRRLKFVREQFFLAATAQNIKRLVRFLSRPTMSSVPATS